MNVEWTDITVKCPSDRVAQAYENHADWLRRVLSANEVEADGKFGIFWDRLSEHARNFFTLCSFTPGKRYRPDELAETLRIPNGRSGVAGIFAWPGRHAKDLGMPYPWSWHNDGSMTFYWLETEEAELFRPMAAEWTKSKSWQALGITLPEE